jgi:dinuclear metal center YbgI/SA1388 family protein
MTVNELYAKLNALIPTSLSCEWDNDGLMCCPDGAREVKKALVCLDVTAAAVKKAIDGGFDVIISHHPFIFKGLKSVTENDFIPQKTIELIRAGISVMSFHTRLDAVSGGVNDTLASMLGLENTEPFGEGIGRIGELDDATDGVSFAKKVKEVLGAPAVFLADSKKAIKRVAVLGGSGDDFISEAIMLGADAYVSGELGHHPMTDAPDMKITLVEAGHFYTEQPVCEALCDMIKKIDSSVTCEIYNSNRTVAI